MELWTRLMFALTIRMICIVPKLLYKLNKFLSQSFNLIICMRHSYLLFNLLEKHLTSISSTTTETDVLVGQEIDMVCFNETPHPTNDRSNAHLLTLCSDTVFAKESSNSGVAHSDLESGIASSNSLPNTCNHQSVSFSSNYDEELIN